MTTIVQATTDDEIAEVRRLMQAFATWRRERPSDDVTGDEWRLADKELETELAELPGRYAPPQGRLLIAFEADQPAGCAALRDQGDGVCEARGIFVTGRFRGQRVGRALVERLLLEAKAAGYRRMRLGTSLHEDDAMRLCERAGFLQIGLDHKGAARMRGPRVLFERDLRLAA